jgi:NADH-quinone oxidoreductase subunit L
MEGPTPASALIHSATMVIAGVYLLIRLFFIINNSTIILNVITVIAISSILIATFGALGEYDIKKVIAQSTVSQLGYMLLSCSISQHINAFYLICTHSLCKALLFLVAGSIIHSLRDEQDIRKMGGLHKTAVVLYSLMLLGSLTLLGFTFSSMHYSKEILFYDLLHHWLFGYLTYSLLYSAAILGVVYVLYLIYIIFLTTTNINKVHYQYLNDNILLVYSCLSTLGLVCYFVGYYYYNVYAYTQLFNT